MNLFSLSMVVILTGIIVVFFVLVLLSVVIRLYSSAVNKHTNKNHSEKFKIMERSKDLNQGYIDNETLAVISAAAYTFCCLGNNKNIVIKKIRKEEFSESSLWRTVGLIENTSNEFYESRF